MKVGSSKVQKTDIRVVAATNLHVEKAITEGKFREDLFYRLNTVPINIIPLRERKDDIHLLFRKFANDFAEKYRMPILKLDDKAKEVLISYRWPGNIRQLKNITEQISIIEQDRLLGADSLKTYIPGFIESKLPALYKNNIDEKTFNSEREILYQVLFDMKKDMSELKRLVADILQGNTNININKDNVQLINELHNEIVPYNKQDHQDVNNNISESIEDTQEFVEESLSIEEKEKELIIKALEKHNGKRKYAAQDLGISERTLYRKIKEYDISN